MSKRYWIALAAIGLAVIACPAQAQVQQEEPAGQGEDANSPSEQLPIPIPVDIVEDDAERDARERYERETIQLQADDLAAQRSMNEASQRMADSAGIQTILVGIGTALLLITLWLTIQANRAAQAAVEVTREVGRDQSRAYLNIRSAEAIHYGTRDIIMTIANTGGSPARWYEIETVASFEPRSEATYGPFRPITFRRDVDLSGAKRWPGPSGGSETTARCGADDIAGVIELATKTPGILAIQGVLRWETIFDEQYSSEFMFFTNRVEMVQHVFIGEGRNKVPVKMQMPPVHLLTYQRKNKDKK